MITDLWLFEDFTDRQTLVEFCTPILVTTARHSAFFVQQRQNTDRLGFYQIDDLLIIVETDELPINTFANIFLFELKDVQRELLLENFVGIVDTELFETVDLKALETINIENTDKVVIAQLGCRSERMIDKHHNPRKEFVIDELE